MEKGFWKLKCKKKVPYFPVLAAGLFLSLISGVLAWRESCLEGNDFLYRNPAGMGDYEQKLTAEIEGLGKIPVNVTVEERQLTAEERNAQFEYAEKILPEILRGENEGLDHVCEDLNFVQTVPGTIVEVSWQTETLEYFSADMTLRKDVERKEPVTVTVKAVLRCQKEERRFQTEITLVPQEKTVKDRLEQKLRSENRESAEKEVYHLPAEYYGKEISWKKPLEKTFLYFLILTPTAVLFLKLGEKRDAGQKKQEEKEEFEKEYAALVSRFAMLLSAGLSVRNAWERIVQMEKKKSQREKKLFHELRRSMYEMQQGVPELEVYERFGDRVGLVRYKKLMALFVSDRKRGSIPLKEEMEREMLEAWEEKKRSARQQGEKTGTKLMIPMMGMLSVVFMIILIPAFLSFRM